MISPTYEGQLYDPTVAAQTTSSSTDSLGQDAFLKMFMAQVTNQNPLDPMDNTEFTAQLATFSQLEQLEKISSSMESLESMDSAIQSATALSYLGKEVAFEGDVLPVTQGYVGSLSYELEANAEVEVTITDASGSTVATLDLGDQDAGTHVLEWEGVDLYGDQVEDGTYQVTITAHDSMGSAVEVNNLTVTGLVTGYQKDSDGKPYLLIGDSALSIDDVLSVRMPEEAEAEAAASALSQYEELFGNDDQGTAEAETGSMSELLKSLATVGTLAAGLL